MAGYPENKTYHTFLSEIIDICKLQGAAFEASVDLSGVSAIPAGESVKTVFVTGSKPVIFYSRKLSYSGDGVNAYLYRDPSYTGGTEAIDINNPNDINPQANESIFLSGATVTDDGIASRAPVYVYGNTSVQGRGEVLEVIDSPQLMAPNSTFLFVLENRDTTNPQDVSSVVEFVEPDRIPGIVLNSDGTFNRYNGKLL